MTASTEVDGGLPEQITDRAIEEVEEDRFGHNDFVARLLRIVRFTETPANVALFGRWGSGKSGIANRLRSESAQLEVFRFAYGGAWDEVERKDDVVSVLLPVTVRSPRRVKVLLNAFAQAFALALARSGSGTLDGNVRARATEIAKLVGLQVEFPLFAADLPIAPDLPGLVLAAADAMAAEEDPSHARGMRGAPRSVRDRAIAYAEGKLPTGESLDSPGESDEAMRDAQGNDLLGSHRMRRAASTDSGSAFIDCREPQLRFCAFCTRQLDGNRNVCNAVSGNSRNCDKNRSIACVCGFDYGIARTRSGGQSP